MGAAPPGEHVAVSANDEPTESVSVARPVRLPLGRDEEVAAGVHEVQNALFSVLGWLEIARGAQEPALRDKALEVITAGVQRARTLVANLADPAERFSVRARSFAVGPVVTEAYELLRPRCASAGVELALDAGHNEAIALGDPDRVVQVLTNLVLNALDAVLARPARGATRGHIDLAVRADASDVTVTVRDDGIGMDAATQARVFEPYFTTHPEADGERREGTGLGLSICRALVEAMRGRLSMNSSPGEGTEVALVLARGDVTLPPAPASDQAPADESGLRPGTRVLVIDDEPAIRELLEVALALRGAEVTTAATLADARHALAHNAYDVVLVDETLGAQDSGAALVVDLGRTMPEITRVLMTGAPSVDHLPAEACRWLLRKPFSLDEAVRTIADALESARS